jgi:formate dehydrogenase beta subunit
MSKVVFSSWAGKIVDNRGLHPNKYANADLELPLKYSGRRVRAFISWNGLVVADDKVDIVDMVCSYLGEVQKLSCGECAVGYLGVKIMLGIFTRIAKGTGSEGDIGRWG